MKFVLEDIINIKELDVDHDIFTESAKYIKYLGKVIGYIEFVYREQDNFIYLDMIEIIEKNCGLGRQVIEWLFIEYKINSMHGEVKVDYELNTYYFWKSLGSDISLDEEEFSERWEGSSFVLHKKDLLNGKK